MKFDKSVFLQKDSSLFTYIKVGNIYSQFVLVLQNFLEMLKLFVQTIVHQISQKKLKILLYQEKEPLKALKIKQLNQRYCLV